MPGGSIDAEYTPRLFPPDRQLGITSVLSANGAGELGNHDSDHPVMSATGDEVAFQSSATNLVPGADANGPARDVYAVTVATRDILRVSLNSDRQGHDGSSFGPSISADGMRIAFTLTAPIEAEDYAHGATGRKHRAQLPHVFVRDLAAGATRRVSRSNGGEPNGPSYLPAISSNGR